jgi:hypothetical protein
VVDYLENNMQGHGETRQGIIDRLNLFIQDTRMNRILCEANPISWKDIIDNHRTLILDCRGMSEDKMIFIGTIVTHGLKSYLRYGKADEFKPVALYVDECHLFLNENYFTILKEGRKYKVAAILATQDFASVPPKLTDTILSNVANLISFRVGFKEANLLSREFPTFQTKDVQNLQKFHCAFRTLKEEGIAKTLPPPFVKIKSIRRAEAEPDIDFRPVWFELVDTNQIQELDFGNVST